MPAIAASETPILVTRSGASCVPGYCSLLRADARCNAGNPALDNARNLG